MRQTPNDFFDYLHFVHKQAVDLQLKKQYNLDNKYLMKGILIMLKKYKSYEFACLSKKNFLISQLLNVLSNTVFAIAAFMAAFFLVRFLPSILVLFNSGG